MFQLYKSFSVKLIKPYQPSGEERVHVDIAQMWTGRGYSHGVVVRGPRGV